MSVPDNFLKDFEAEGPVPEYLKDALISEIDFIRDAMFLISHSVSHLMDTAVHLISEADSDKEE